MNLLLLFLNGNASMTISLSQPGLCASPGLYIVLGSNLMVVTLTYLISVNVLQLPTQQLDAKVAPTRS